MDEVTKLLAEIKETLARKDETYALIADSKPGKDCPCESCYRARVSKIADAMSIAGKRLRALGQDMSN